MARHGDSRGDSPAQSHVRRPCAQDSGRGVKKHIVDDRNVSGNVRKKRPLSPKHRQALDPSIPTTRSELTNNEYVTTTFLYERKHAIDGRDCGRTNY